MVSLRRGGDAREGVVRTESSREVARVIQYPEAKSFGKRKTTKRRGALKHANNSP